MSTLIF